MHTNGLQAGTAKIDITPPLSIPYLGFVPRQARFASVHDPLHARALVLRAGRTQVGIVAADAIGFSDHILGPGRSFHDEFRRRVHQRTGIEADALMLAASHAHATPETLDITPLAQVAGALSWVEKLIEQLVSVVAEALHRLQPVQVRVGTGRATGIAVNRRQLLADGTLWQPAHGDPQATILRAGPVDEGVGVVRLDFADGTCAALVNFTCHAVSVQVQPRISADFPGVACALAEDNVPRLRHCLFLQGAAGDINPRGGGLRRSFADVARYGDILGTEIVRVLGRLQATAGASPAQEDADKGGTVVPARLDAARHDTGTPPPDPREPADGAPADLRIQDAAASSPLHVASRLIQLPPRELPDPEPFRAERDRARQAVQEALETTNRDAEAEAGTDGDRAATDEAHGNEAAADGARVSTDALFAARNALRVAEETLRTIETGGVPVPAMIQAIRLGDLCLVGIPGELFLELGQEIQTRSAARHTLIVGYANGYAGYLSTPTAFREGGYETALGPWCRVGPEGGRLCVETALELIRELFAEG